MEMMISLKDVGLILLFAAAIVLIVFLVILIRNLNETIKNATKVLEDVKVVSEIAQRRLNEVDGVMDDVISSVGSLSKALKGEESSLKSISSIAKAVTSVINIFKKEDKKDKKD